MNPPKNRIKVLLVDDQPLFVQSLARVIEFRAADIEVVGIAEDGMEAVAKSEALQPDVIVMDIQMPVMNGVEAARIILKSQPEIKIMMLTTFDEDEYVIESLLYGTRGYLLKNIPPEEVIIAVRALYSGINQISPNIVNRITSRMLNAQQGDGPDLKNKKSGLPQWFMEMTNLEKILLRHLSQGMSNKEIASEEHLAEQTVKNYLCVIYEKMAVNKRALAIKKYLDDRIDEYSS